jgi:hypothetical protein
MYDLSGKINMTTAYTESLSKSIDAASLDEVLAIIDVHSKMMEIYMEGVHRKNAKINLKDALKERATKAAKKSAIEIAANATITPKVKVPAAPKAPLTPEAKMRAAYAKQGYSPEQIDIVIASMIKPKGN